MQIDLSGKHAIVCGGSRGIGRACAHELARLGARVTVVARNEKLLRSVVDELRGITKKPHDSIAADFLEPEVVEEKVHTYLSRNGNTPVHILVNNTGGPPPGSLLEAELEDFLPAFYAHLLCNHLLTLAVLPGMRTARYGRIINIISTSVKQPIKGLGVSNTIRAAVANWAKTLAGEVAGEGITVNNVLPGATNTERLQALLARRARTTGKSEEAVLAELQAEIPAGRIGEPEEVAAAVAFLASPAAAYINGINLPVDGGRTSCL